MEENDEARPNDFAISDSNNDVSVHSDLEASIMNSSPPPPPLPNASPSPAQGTPRLAIHSLVLQNFKSYGGQVHVGPFHKNFSAIVGPNGSGKSNVIDAMLFVFGRAAKHLRHSKLSELLHNSATYPNVPSATVTVLFHDIVDTGDGDADFTVLPNSEFSVARTAYRNNTSKYFLNDVEVKRKEVVELLKSKGVDLDHNRFLILQGEVEQIAMMKPKSTNAHDLGLLEYLEDIIGSNRHIEKIEETATAVEALNEERGHKLNRVKAAESERDSLESAKIEAEDYIDKERNMLGKKSTLNKAQQFDASAAFQEHSQQYDQAKAKVDGFKTEVTEKEASVTNLEKDYNEIQKHESLAVRELNKAKESYAAFERKDIKLREDMKALKTKDKKLKGVIEREQKRVTENATKVEQYTNEKETAEGSMEKAEADITNAQNKFDKTRDKVKKNTQPVRDRLEKKQTDLLPFSESVNNARKDLQINQSNLKLLEERLAAPQINLDEASKSLEQISSDLQEATERLRKFESECEEQKKCVYDSGKESATRRARVDDLSAQCSSMRRKVEEARAAREFTSTRSRLHSGILSASRNGRLCGVVGRLGDLASVDDRFATAVSAAAGANLDCIVVQTAENAQACIQFLRSENLGRATFIILEKIEYLRSPLQAWTRSDRSQDGRRLFDYLKIPNAQHCTAVYYSLRDTLVADSLEEARRMAFKPTRQNRVVTLVGELIESTGAMTGGGRGPTKYKLGSGRGGEGEMDSDSFTKLCDDVESVRRQILEENSFIDQAENKRRMALTRVEELEVVITKCKVEVSSLESRVDCMKNDTIPALQKALKDNQLRIQKKKCEATKKHQEAANAVKQGEKVLVNAKAACEDIEADIVALQDEILAAGGSELDQVKEELESCRKKVSELQSEVSTASSRAAAAQKVTEKAEKAADVAEKAREEAAEDRVKAKEESEAMLDDAEKVADKIREAEEVHTEWAEKLNEVQADYTDVKGALKSLRRKEVSLVEAADGFGRLVTQDKHHIRFLKKEEKTLGGKIKRLSMMDIAPARESSEKDQEASESVDDEDNSAEEEGGMEIEEVEDGEEDDEDSDVKKEKDLGDEYCISRDERKKLETEIGVLESELAEMSPNINAIADYACKDREYRGQVCKLDDVTKRRDESRKECDGLRKARLDEFMQGFSTIMLKLKELYQMITLGGDAELELVDSLDPFSEGIVFSVRPPKKSWKNICNLSGGEKTLSSLALVFALHHFKPTPVYFLDEMDAALDYKNVSIVGNYVKERTKNAQFIIISLRNNMFELADRLVGIYKTHHTTKSVTINPRAFVMPAVETTQVTTQVTQTSLV